MSINASSRLISDENFVKFMTQSVEEKKISPSRVKVEVTERILMQGDLALERLNSVRRAGFLLTLDDFGTGYSSLEYLIKFDVDALKIDQSFVRKIEDDPKAQVIISSIVQLANGLSVPVIAEGIETENQYVILRAMGCKYGQGYLYGKPLPIDEAVKFLKHDKEAS